MCVVAIAKNEARFIEEWIAHYLSIGVDALYIYDNESDDETRAVVEAIGSRYPIYYQYWVNPLNASPQRAAYNHFLNQNRFQYDWMGFFDIDEFLVIHGKSPSIHRVMATYGDNVAAVGVNWVTIGSSGHPTSNYGLVRDAFTKGPARDFGNNKHFKSIMRPQRVEYMHIHHCVLKSGEYVHADGSPIEMPRRPGMSAEPHHGIMQVNHYQVKSLEDFWNKIRRGRATKKVGDPAKFRGEQAEVLLAKIDKMDAVYNDISSNSDAFYETYHYIRALSGR